jgi:hypothetical protein
VAARLFPFQCTTNSQKPELTATPFVETTRGPVAFKNVIYDYPLGKAMEDGFVKKPAVVTLKDFNPAGMSPEEIERLKLEDGVRLHESVKVELETYARESDNPIVKPFLLIIARDTTHASLQRYPLRERKVAQSAPAQCARHDDQLAPKPCTSKKLRFAFDYLKTRTARRTVYRHN